MARRISLTVALSLAIVAGVSLEGCSGEDGGDGAAGGGGPWDCGEGCDFLIQCEWATERGPCIADCEADLAGPEGAQVRGCLDCMELHQQCADVFPPALDGGVCNDPCGIGPR